MDRLKKILQCCLQNTFYKVRFGAHNDREIHGACPFEMLHFLLLGIFKYVQDMFFEQVGTKGAIPTAINALAKQYGKFLARQSERDLPNASFATVMDSGRKQAKDYTGILLCIAMVLRSTQGQFYLKQKKSREIAQDFVIQDWLLLVETLLEWEAWLKSDEMTKNHVERAKKSTISSCI